jgi:hypothetical protein
MLQRTTHTFVLVLGMVLLLVATGCRSGASNVATSEGTGTAGGSETHVVTSEIVEEDGARFLVATVTPGAGYHCNLDYPRWGVQVADDAPAAAGARRDKDDATVMSEDSVTFRIPLDDDASEGEVQGQVRLSVCNDDVCLTPTENVTWLVASGL